ncbi:MAG: hypothetical protein WC455_16050 [Dehalococcoidia bacterium]|jgi:hypothetical protein
MAQQVTSDTLLLGIYKSWYTEKRFPNLLFRNSPVLKEIQKNRIGGRDYKISMLYGRGGAVSGDYTVAVANAASSSRNAEMTVVPGNIHTVFNVTQKEILASQKTKGAYVPALINKMFAATEATRKTFAGCLYGFGVGDMGTLPVVAATGASTMTLTYDTIVKLDIGTQFYVATPVSATACLPTAAFYDATVRTVSAIDGTTVTWTGGVVGGTPWAVGSLICLVGGRDATPVASMPTGLAAWLPSMGGRTGATWNTYIGTAFYGVTRSANTNQLAGWFYQRQPGEAMGDALTQGIKLARRGGGVPNMLAINDEDYQSIVYELNQQTALMQHINTSDKKSDNAVVRGINKLKYAFSTSYLDVVYDDPYCPKGTGYILDKDVIEFAALSNTSDMDSDGVSGNDPGAASVESAKDPDTQFKMIIDDCINVVPNSTSVEGPAAQVSISVYGNFVVHEPGHCAVVVF